MLQPRSRGLGRRAARRLRGLQRGGTVDRRLLRGRATCSCCRRRPRLPWKLGELDQNDASLDGDAWVRKLFTHYVPFTAMFNITGQPAISLPLAWSGRGTARRRPARRPLRRRRDARYASPPSSSRRSPGPTAHHPSPLTRRRRRRPDAAAPWLTDGSSRTTMARGEADPGREGAPVALPRRRAGSKASCGGAEAQPSRGRRADLRRGDRGGPRRARATTRRVQLGYAGARRGRRARRRRRPRRPASRSRGCSRTARSS